MTCVLSTTSQNRRSQYSNTPSFVVVVCFYFFLCIRKYNLFLTQRVFFAGALWRLSCRAATRNRERPNSDKPDQGRELPDNLVNGKRTLRDGEKKSNASSGGPVAFSG